MMVLRRLAHPDDARLGPPLRVVVTTARSLLQPMAPDLAEIEPVTLTVGPSEAELRRRARTPGRAGLHPRRHGRQARRVRGTRRHPRRLPADRRTSGARRVLGRRGVRDADVLGRRPALHPGDRRRHRRRGAVPGAAAHRGRARAGRGALAAEQPGGENRVTGTVGDMLAKLAEGIPVDGMEALLPVLRPTELALLHDQLPAAARRAGLRPREGAHPRRRPDQDRSRVPRGVVVGGGDRRQTRRSTSSSSAVRASATSRAARSGANATGHPWWTLSQLANESARRARHPARPVGAWPAARSRRDVRDAAGPRRDGWRSPRSSPPAPAPRTASSSSWAKPTLPQRCWSREPRRSRAWSGCSRARCATA